MFPESNPEQDRNKQRVTGYQLKLILYGRLAKTKLCRYKQITPK